jgi:hypothetical protein
VVCEGVRRDTSIDAAMRRCVTTRKNIKKHDGVVYVKKKQYLCKTKIIVYAEI